MDNQIQGQSLKKYSAAFFTNALKTVQFPNNDIFSKKTLLTQIYSIRFLTQ